MKSKIKYSTQKRKAASDEGLFARVAAFNKEEREVPTTRTNIVMEEPLVAAAQKITGIKTKTGVIHFALNELVRRKKMKEILEFQGKVDFWDGFEAEMAGTK